MWILKRTASMSKVSYVSEISCSSARLQIKNTRLVSFLTLVDIARLDIKRREPGILFISLPIVSLFKLAIMA